MRGCAWAAERPACKWFCALPVFPARKVCAAGFGFFSGVAGNSLSLRHKGAGVSGAN